MNRDCTIVRIRKKNGTFRTIYVPCPEFKARLAKLVPTLTGRCVALDIHRVLHAFMPGRSPVTNAKAHRWFRYTLSMDLKDWFDTVTCQQVFTADPFQIATAAGWDTNQCFVDGAPRQGLPTSPAIANISGVRLDRLIMAHQKRGRFTNFVYTRYADDLTLSSDSFDILKEMAGHIKRHAEACGFQVNDAKTHIQAAVAGRRIITGVAVDDTIHSTRQVKRRLRAARHQMENGVGGRNLLHIRGMNRERVKVGLVPFGHDLAARLRREGLEEWARLRLPAVVASTSAPLPSPIIQAVRSRFQSVITFITGRAPRKFS